MFAQFIHVLSLALEFVMQGAGSVFYTVGGVKKEITVSLVGPATTPVPRFTLAEGFEIATAILEHGHAEGQLRVGADLYNVTVTDAQAPAANA